MEETAVITQQPAATAKTQTNQRVREWSSGLCGCFQHFPSCLCSFIFGPCYQCYIATEMGENCCVPCCVQGGLIAMRTKLRTENNIQGSICGDCCTLMFCGPCALAQMKREMTYVSS